MRKASYIQRCEHARRHNGLHLQQGRPLTQITAPNGITGYFTYDAANNVSTRTDTDGTVTPFGYDPSDQLTSEVRDNSHSTGYSLAYTYDHNHNRASKTQAGVTTTYAYDAHDKLTSVGAKTYGYDLNGNCTSVTVGSSVTSLTYDVENRVTSITYPGGATNPLRP